MLEIILLAISIIFYDCTYLHARERESDDVSSLWRTGDDKELKQVYENMFY